MKYLLFTTVTLFCALLFSNPAFAFGGSEVGNGTDQPVVEQGSAWFIGRNRTIDACVEIAPNFGKTSSELEANVKSSFDKWVRYIKEADIYNIQGYRQGSLQISETLSLHFGCRGHEDLSFYFGIENDAVLKSKAEFYDPLAFAQRNSFDYRKGWSQGFIWVSPSELGGFPDWNVPHLLEIVLLHEVGHIFGNAHTPLTIMDEGLSKLLKEKLSDSSFKRKAAAQQEIELSSLNRIDQFKVLLSCEFCDLRFHTSSKNAVPGFELLAGRKQKGELFCSALKREETYYISCRDELGEKKWEVGTFYRTTEKLTTGNKLFKRVAIVDGTMLEEGVISQSGAVGLGTIEASKQVSLNAWVQLNPAGNSGLNISLLKDGKYIELFWVMQKPEVIRR